MGMLVNSYLTPAATTTVVVTLGADKDTTVTLSGGNLVATKNGTTGNAWAFATEGKDSGKFYFECTATALSTQELTIGLTGGLFTTDRASFLGASGFKSVGLNSNGAGVIINNATDVAGTFVQGDVLGFAVDVTNGIVWVSKNGTYLSGNPAAGTGGTVAAAFIPRAWYPSVWLDGANSAVTFNFGATSFSTSPPSGFSAWNVSSAQGGFTTFRSAAMYVRSLGFFSHAMAEFELMASSGGANVLSGATVTSSASITAGALANVVDGSTSTFVSVGSTGAQNQSPAYFAMQLAANATLNVIFAAVRGRDGGGGGELQTPTLFDLWTSTGTVSTGTWYRAKVAVSLSAFAGTTPGERKEFAVP